ncbi:MAG: hypothetical protein JJE04_11680 [Acidobacteriia bacterium]|nr:hypothetical protein [Terriglobia bacterium]
MRRLAEILNEGKAKRQGAHPSNLSPYGTIVQYLFEAEKDKMVSLLKNEKSKIKILIAAEVELPADVNRAEIKNAVFVSGNAA